MAKKGMIDFDDNNLDFSNDDFDDFALPKVRQPKNAREAVAQAAPSVLEGFTDAAQDPNTIRRMMEKALPKSFGYTLSEVDNYASSYDQLSRQINKEFRPTMTAMTKVAKRVNDMLPHPFQDRFGKYLDGKLRTDEQAKQFDAEEAAVQMQLAEGMGQDGPLTENGRAEEAIDKIDERSYRVKMFQSIAEMRNMQRQTTQYTFTQQRAYQRKVLEVQIRQLMTQRKTLELTGRMSTEMSTLLRDIVKNTGLPEFAKEHNNESFRRTAREMMFGRIQRPIANWSQNYLKNVTKNIQGVATRSLQSMRSGAENAEETIKSIDEAMKQAEEFGESKMAILGNLTGSELFEYLGGKTADQIRKLIPNAGGIDNFFSMVTRKLRDAPFAASKWGSKATGMNFLSELRRTLYVGYDKDENQVVRGSGLKGVNGLDFEARQTRALEEILPGYLSRILHSMEMWRTGDDTIPRTVYSREKGAFTTFDESSRRLENAIASNGKVANPTYDMNQLMTQMGIGEADGALRMKVGQHLMEVTNTATGFDPEELLNNKFGNLTDRERKRLLKALKKSYGLSFSTEKGKWVSGLKANNAAILDSQTRFRRMQQGQTSIYNNVQAAINTGNQEELAALGIIRYDEDEKAWVIADDYMQKRRKAAVVNDVIKNRNERAGKGNPPPKPSDVLPNPTPPTDDGDDRGGRGFGFGGISSRGAKSLGRDIRDQTDVLVDNIQELIGVAHDQYDVLDDIFSQLQAGITTHGIGMNLGLGKLPGRLMKGAGKLGRKIWDISGYPFRGMRWAGKKMLSPLGNWIKTRDVKGKVDKLRTDVYAMGESGLKRVLEAIGFEDGRYVNMADGSPIRNLRDIKGAVYDKIKQMQVLSEEEFQKGLLNSAGEKILGGIKGLFRNTLTKGLGLMTTPFTATWNFMKKTTNTLVGTFMAPPDIYVPGEQSPRILGQLMFRGNHYYSAATGKPLKYLGDIDGAIMTINRITGVQQTVITDEEVRAGLVDVRGKPLTPFFRKLRNAVDWVKDKAIGLIKLPGRMLSWMKDKAKGLGSLVGKGLNGLLGMGHGGKLSQVYWLENIYNLIYTKFTGGTIGGNPMLPAPGAARVGTVGASLGTAAGKAAEAASKAAKKAKDKAKKARDRFDKSSRVHSWADKLGLRSGTASTARVKDSMEDLHERAGSWLNQQKAQMRNKIENVTDRIKDKREQGGGILGSLSTMFLGGLAGLFTKLMGKLSFIKPALTKIIPDSIKLLGRGLLAKRGADAAGGVVEDALIGNRRSRWGRRLATSRLGRFAANMASRAAPWLGRAATVAGATALGTGSATAAVSGATAAAGAAAATVGSTVAAGATAAGGLLATAGGALATIGGLLLSPWVLGAAALGAVLFGGWKLYQYYKRKGDFTPDQRVRLISYGLQLDEQHDACAKVLGLEDYVAQAVVWQNGSVSFDSSKIDMKGIAELFGVTSGTGKQFAMMSAWFTRRFLPIYGSWLQSAKRAGNVETLTGLSKNVSSSIVTQIMRGAFLGGLPPERSPYYVTESPIPGYYITQGTKRIEAYMEQVALELSKDVSKASKVDTRGIALGKRDGFTPPPSSVLKGPSILPASTPGVDKSIDDYYGASERLTRGKITGNQVSDDVIAKFNQIDDMTALRMKVYGLNDLHKTYVDILLRFEQELYKHVTWNAKGQAVLDFATPTEIFTTYASIFKLDAHDSTQAETFNYWLSNRFLPGYTTFLAACHAIDPNGNPFTAYGRFRAAELLKVATEVYGAKATNAQGRQYSVWAIDALPFAGERANLTASSAAVNIAVFERAIKTEQYQDSKVQNRVRLSTRGETLVSQKATDLMGDLAAITGDNKSYQLSSQNNNAYSASNNISTSWTSAGYEGSEVSNVKLNGNAKTRGEMLMKIALSEGISGDELALFMGTAAQETGDFNDYRENKPDIAAYARNKNLGNRSMEDAARFIGRGPIQMTGYSNYANATKWLQAQGINVDFVKNPELMEDEQYGALAMVAYWKNYLRPLIAKKGRQLDPLTVSAATNGWYEDPNGPGGLRTPNGYDVRLKKILQWRKILNGEAPNPTLAADDTSEADKKALANAQPGPNGDGSAAPGQTPAKGAAPTGGQATAPQLPGASTAPMSPTSPTPAAPLAGGQETAPPLPATPAPKPTAPSQVLSRPVGTNNVAEAAYQQRQIQAQQPVNTRQAVDPMANIGNRQVEELVLIRKLLEERLGRSTGTQTAPQTNPAMQNSQPTPPLAQNNSNANQPPKATPASVAPPAAQSTPTETAAAKPASRPSAPQQADPPLPFNTNV